MSRSIHETRKMLRDTRREDWVHHEEQEARIADLDARLKRKKQIKDKIIDEHKTDRALQATEEIIINTDTNAIPIIIEDQGPYIHYPATPDDLRAIMNRLPKGVCDGITQIELTLGAKEPTSDWAKTLEHKPDPYTGRVSKEMLTDVWARDSLGVYLEETARIRILAYVYPPAIEGLAIKEYLLKLRMLSTFIHEVAHHYDFTRRSARGRWITEEGGECEDYASELQHEWLHQVVVPYLETTYPEETRHFIGWVEYQGGIRLTLGQMAGDPRRCIFDIMQTLFFLITRVEEDEDKDQRYGFADYLHMDGFYEEALKIIDTLLQEEKEEEEEEEEESDKRRRRRNLWLLRLRAHIFIDQGGTLIAEGNQEEGRRLLEKSRALTLQILEEDPDYANAWRELWYACEGLELWEEMIRATTREFELEGSDLKLAIGTLLPRIRASIALGDFAGAEVDIQLLEQSPSEYRQKQGADYRLKLRQAIAQKHETQKTPMGELES